MDSISFICWFRFPNLWQGTSSHQGNFADYWVSVLPPPGPASFTVTRRPETTESSFLIKVNGILLFHWRTERLLRPAAARWRKSKRKHGTETGKLTVNALRTKINRALFSQSSHKQGPLLSAFISCQQQPCKRFQTVAEAVLQIKPIYIKLVNAP